MIFTEDNKNGIVDLTMFVMSKKLYALSFIFREIAMFPIDINPERKIAMEGFINLKNELTQIIGTSYINNNSRILPVEEY